MFGFFGGIGVKMTENIHRRPQSHFLLCPGEANDNEVRHSSSFQICMDWILYALPKQHQAIDFSPDHGSKH